MKKILSVFVIMQIFVFTILPAEAKIKKNINKDTQVFEEVVLQDDTAPEADCEDTEKQVVSVSENVEEKSLREKLQDVYNIEIYKYDTPSYLFKDIFTHTYDEKSIMDKTQLWGAYNGALGVNFIDNGTVSNHYDFNAVNVGFDGFLKNNNADFRIMMNFSPYPKHMNYTQKLFSDVFVASNKIPHHRIQAGYFRPQVGMEGGNSSYTLPFLNRSQISRTYGLARKLGARVKGDYSLLDYDFGLYSSGTYFKDFFPGEEFVGWVNIKPLGKTNGKYGNLKIGSGLQAGHRNSNYCVTGAYIGYEYKKFMANFEWAQGNGYNGGVGHSNNHTDGFYTTIGYMLTRKMQLLARYDQFDPNKKVSGNNRREYTLGFNYFIKGQALRLIMNYVYSQNDAAKDSHRIMLGTQILL